MSRYAGASSSLLFDCATLISNFERRLCPGRVFRVRVSPTRRCHCQLRGHPPAIAIKLRPPKSMQMEMGTRDGDVDADTDAGSSSASSFPDNLFHIVLRA